MNFTYLWLHSDNIRRFQMGGPKFGPWCTPSKVETKACWSWFSACYPLRIFHREKLRTEDCFQQSRLLSQRKLWKLFLILPCSTALLKRLQATEVYIYTSSLLKLLKMLSIWVFYIISLDLKKVFWWYDKESTLEIHIMIDFVLKTKP